MSETLPKPHLQISSLPPALPPIFIIADDLTGACDSAVQFLEKACTVRVCLDPTPVSGSISFEPGSVVAFSTESRNSSASASAHAAERVVAAISHRPEGSILFKKVDSAGRGQIGAETIAVLTASRAELALVAPSFPTQGRTVVDGTLHIRDSALRGTSLHLPSLFPASQQSLLGLVPAVPVPEMKNQIDRAVEQGQRILICDAQTQDDLDRVISAAHHIVRPILWAGSAGLARSLAASYSAHDRNALAGTALANGRTLLFAGTDHPVTVVQLDELGRDPGFAKTHIHRVAWDLASAASLRAVFDEYPVGSLILTGGDTAAFVLKALGAVAVRLTGQLAPGIPWGIIEGGHAAGCRVITKSGGFGSPDALIHAVNFCSRRSCESA